MNFYDFSISDLILYAADICAVWFLLYQVFMFLRGTKAMQVLFGLMIFVAIYFISDPALLDLATLHWILNKFLSYFVVIVVIIFQEDIRRGLGEFGKAEHFGKQGSEARLAATPIEEIVRAASIMSDRRIGALIAIEMDALLDQYMVMGINIDAAITNELLVALFIPYKANPTHDGAVVIRNQRIERAGCFLPLSPSDRIDQTLGTRHRAAVGLSESTDAVIIVVSEETGAISIAHDGKLMHRLTTRDLRDYLHSTFSRTKTKGHDSALIRRLRQLRTGKR